MSVVVLFDNTRTSAAPEIRERYLQGFARVVSAVIEDGGGAYIAGFSIDDNSGLNPDKFTATFPRQGGNTTKFRYRVETRKVRKHAESRARALVSAPAERSGTAILDAIELAPRFFADHPESNEPYVILFSDMIEESDRLTWRMVETAESRSAFIAAERESGRLPDLSGVGVYVAGIGPNPISTQAPQRTRAWRDFWYAYFEAAGAEVRSWGTSVGRFPPADPR